MSQSTKDKVLGRRRRHKRVRLKVKGSPERPRLSVYRSLKHIYAQIIDDVSGRTLISVSSLGMGAQGNVKTASEIGKKLAENAKSAKLDRVVFDRGGCLYHGRIKALADSAREGGLVF